MLFLLIVAMLIGAALGGAWFGRLSERAVWSRRLYARGINPATLRTNSEVASSRDLAPEPLAADADAMRDAMADMAREVERLAEGQRFLTDVLRDKGPVDGAHEPERRSPPLPDDPAR